MAGRLRDPWSVEAEDRDEREGGAVGSVAGARVRLSFLTWERIVGAIALVALCVFFVDDPPVDDGTIKLQGHSGLVESVLFSPDGEMLVSSSWDRSVRLWNTGPSSLIPGEESACLPSNAEMYTSSISPDGGTIASSGLVGLTLWNWRDAHSLPDVKTQFGPCRASAYSPDGLSLAVASFDKNIRIWEPRTDRVRAVLRGHHDVVRKLTFVPDGSMLISLSFDGALKFWDMKTDREVVRLDGMNGNVHSFGLSPDGGTIALSRLAPGAQRIEFWDLATDRLRFTSIGHAAEIHALVFSPDGRTLASAGGDQKIRFWNPETGAPAGELGRPVGWVRSLDISRDGRWLAYSGSFNQVYLKRLLPPNTPAPAVHSL